MSAHFQKELPQDDTLLKMINPEILSASGEALGEEGCLSIPNVTEKVVRSELVTVKYLNENGEQKTLEASGLLAICIQHEIDHLDGVLFIDKLTGIRRQRVRSKLKKLSKLAK